MIRDPLPDHVRALVDDFKRSGLSELHLRTEELEFHLAAREGSDPDMLMDEEAASSPRRAPTRIATDNEPSPAQAAKPRIAVPDGAEIVTAPYLGTFYRAPKPGSAAYVEVGSTVDSDSEVCLVEVMKLFTAVRAGHAGTIVAILAEDGALVSPDQPLFAIEAR